MFHTTSNENNNFFFAQSVQNSDAVTTCEFSI
jgi:hypothetical protein